MITDTKPKLPSEPESVARLEAIESDRATCGQRRINLIWELTQAAVTVSITLAALYSAVAMIAYGESNQVAVMLLSNALFLVIGFYFGRTNHEKTGGVRSKEAGR